MKPASNYVVAVDAVGAGMGEVVVVVQGGSSRMTELTRDRPVDAAITCIVDSVEIEGKLTYYKSARKIPEPRRSAGTRAS
jgi:microcompartment protein CcmK/EutM